MENVYIKIHFRFPLKAKPTNHSVTIINSTTTLIRSEIETAAHTQYIRDIAVDMANAVERPRTHSAVGMRLEEGF